MILYYPAGNAAFLAICLASYQTKQQPLLLFLYPTFSHLSIRLYHPGFFWRLEVLLVWAGVPLVGVG